LARWNLARIEVEVCAALIAGAIQTDVFGLPKSKCRNAASGDSPNTINLGNALGKFKPKISPERAPHFVATKRKGLNHCAVQG
jgi:hypothetical protein